jgi:hypothetical protein
MNENLRIEEIKKGVEKVSKRTLSHFSKIYNIPKSEITNTSIIESEVYNLFIFDYALHSHQMTSEFRQKYLFATMDSIEEKYGSELTNNNLKELINERFNQYAGLPGEGDDWPRKANELLLLNLKGSVNNNTMVKHYPIVPEDIMQSMTNSLEFAQVHSSDFKEITNIVNGLYGKKKKEGCYIATMVYKDYDAEEVITLRNFRDNVLAKNILGKFFIKIYYMTSPFFVRIFEKNDAINNIIKKELDRIVNRIKTKHNNV